MTNAELLAKIKAEIESWLREYAEDSQFELGERYGYKRLLTFLSTLESENLIPNDLEEASSKFATHTAPNGVSVEFLEEKLSFQEGAKWQKKQMMKEAVEGKIIYLLNGDVAVNIGDTDKYNLGDKVRVIVLPKEDSHDTRRKE